MLFNDQLFAMFADQKPIPLAIIPDDDVPVAENIEVIGRDDAQDNGFNAQLVPPALVSDGHKYGTELSVTFTAQPTVSDDGTRVARDIEWTSDAVQASPSKRFFEKRFVEIERTLDYNPAWSNGTGYLDGIVSNPDVCLIATTADDRHPRLIQYGEQAKAIDDKGRKIIVTGTAFGPIVVLERYSGSEANPTYVYHAPDAVHQAGIMGTHRAMTLDALHHVLGTSAPENIGYVLNELRRSLVEYFDHATELEARLADQI